jgi:hypothetical protein
MLRWVAIVVILSMCVAGSAMAADEPWRDTSQPPGQRAAELLAAMTPEQKVAMALGDYASLASLGVPTLPSADGPSGIRADGTTSFPSAQTLAATFDRDLARAYGEAIGAEARGKGFNWWLGPAMDIARTPLAGRQPAGDEALAAQVRDLAPRVFELSEFLVGHLGVEDVGAAFHHRVTYHPTCHSLRLLKVGDAPVRLLRAVRGLDLVELPAAEQCCGFGGTFAVKNADTSTAMLTDKLRRILDTGADVCTAADNSCLMHIGGGLRHARAGVRVMHLAEILAMEDA